HGPDAAGAIQLGETATRKRHERAVRGGKGRRDPEIEEGDHCYLSPPCEPRHVMRAGSSRTRIPSVRCPHWQQVPCSTPPPSSAGTTIRTGSRLGVPAFTQRASQQRSQSALFH